MGSISLMIKYWWLQEKVLVPHSPPWRICSLSGHFTSGWCWGPDIRKCYKGMSWSLTVHCFCTPGIPPHYLHVSPMALLFNRTRWFVKENAPQSPWTDLEPCERKYFSTVTLKISCGATDTLNVSGDPTPEETNRVLCLLLSAESAGEMAIVMATLTLQKAEPVGAIWGNKFISDSTYREIHC